MAKSKYALAGVDFEKEHDVVDVMVRVGEETSKNIKDLEKYGITLPEQGSDFSGSIEYDLEKLVKTGAKKIIQSGGVDGPGSKPVVHALYNGKDPVKLGCTAIDSIAMGANDVICSGARPFLILEYHSWHDTNVDVAKQMARGKVIAAELSKAAIIGGENASLSAMITGPVPEKAYDMCNTVLGLITDDELINNPLGKKRVGLGDVVIGLSSSGIHCNGVTLGWKTAIDYTKCGYINMSRINKKDRFLGESVAQAILTPTTIYVEPILSMIEEYGDKIKAIANITGEGIDNMKRILPKGLGLNLDYERSCVQKPHKIFKWIQKQAGVPIEEMYQDYNMGTGIAVIVQEDSARSVIRFLNKQGKNQKYDWQKFRSYELGEVSLTPRRQKINLVTYNGISEFY